MNKQQIRPSISILILFLLSFSLLGKQESKKASLDTSNAPQVTILNKEILLGDFIQYQVLVPNDGSDITLQTTDFSPFELVKKTSKLNKQTNNIEYLIQLTIYDTGKQTIPPLTFSKIQKQKTTTFTLPEKNIVIQSVLKTNDKNAQIKDIKGSISVKEKDYILLYVTIGAMLALLVIIILQKIKKKYNSHDEKIIIEEKLPAHEIAYKKLSQLINKNLIEAGKNKEYAFVLSEIIREFIGNRYEFDSIELTSDELLDSIRTLALFNRDYQPVIRNFLEDSDLVKFSKLEASLDDMNHLTQMAFKIVDDLKIKLVD